MNELQAFSKQLFGAKYERILRSLIICIIVYSSIYAAEIRIAIAPFILYLTAAAFSVGIMWQTLNSQRSSEIMTGLFTLPFENRRMTFSVTAAFSGYTFITRSLIVLSLLWSVSNWSFAEIAISILCAAAGCLITAAWFTMNKSKKIISAVIFGSAAFLAVFIAKDFSVIAIILISGIPVSLLLLWNADAYAFYKPQNTLLIKRYKSKSGNIIFYLIRYLMTNKNYLINTAGLCLFAIFLPYVFGQFKEIDAMPMGFAILCLNTPICVLLSIDRDLEQAVRMLPKQLR
ncbi:MAG: hypothetical protein J6A07_00165, partial [Firmicutes bacterium]|nr:hypothetical protein [Bacillota bacterium]